VPGSGARARGGYETRSRGDCWRTDERARPAAKAAVQPSCASLRVDRSWRVDVGVLAAPSGKLEVSAAGQPSARQSPRLVRRGLGPPPRSGTKDVRHLDEDELLVPWRLASEASFALARRTTSTTRGWRVRVWQRGRAFGAASVRQVSCGGHSICLAPLELAAELSRRRDLWLCVPASRRVCRFSACSSAAPSTRLLIVARPSRRKWTLGVGSGTLHGGWCRLNASEPGTLGWPAGSNGGAGTCRCGLASSSPAVGAA
jgi:hypothetical protein